MVIALNILVVGLLVLLAARERTESRAITALTSTMSADRHEFIALVDRIAQRIQAPEQAVVEHAQTVHTATPPAVGVDDDDAYWEAATLTREQLAQAAFEAELAGTVSE